MRLRSFKEAWLIIIILEVATLVIGVSGADLAVSAYFHRSGTWPVGEAFPWKLLYTWGCYPAAALALAGFVAAVRGCFVARWRPWRKAGIFLVLLMLMGPLLVVNGVFKDHWGRPRPRQIIQFGGAQQFLQPWQPGAGEGRSFPSGHASMAFYMMAPYFIYRRDKPVIARRWLVSGNCFGLLMGFARIVQGGHFLSDVVWSWGMIYLVALGLSSMLGNVPYSRRRILNYRSSNACATG